MGSVNSFLSVTHRVLSKSKFATFITAKIRNQCDLIIRQRFAAPDMNPFKNGEYLLLETVIPDCKIFFDVGANKGEWTNFIVESKKTDPFKCYLFEPGLAAFSVLQNRFKNDIVELSNIAISNSFGTLDFYEEENAGEMSSAIKGWANNKTQVTKVPCSTIDQEITERGIEFLDFLKIDVEGFDLKVIEGALNSLREKKIGIIQFEYGEGWLKVGVSLSGAYQIFAANDYDIYLITQKGLVNYDINTYGDFYSFSNFLAVSAKSRQLIKNLVL